MLAQETPAPNAFSVSPVLLSGDTLCLPFPLLLFDEINFRPLIGHSIH